MIFRQLMKPIPTRYRNSQASYVAGVGWVVMSVAVVIGLADEKPLPKKGAEIDATTLRH